MLGSGMAATLQQLASVGAKLPLTGSELGGTGAREGGVRGCDGLGVAAGARAGLRQNKCKE